MKLTPIPSEGEPTTKNAAHLMFNYYYSVPDEPNVGTSSASFYAMRLGVFW